MTDTGRRHIFLIGFMAVGKSTIGRRVSELLGLPFEDLDQRIAARSGASIPELFASVGERGFRTLEAEELARVAAGPPALIATGGGAPCHGDNLQVMRTHGLVIALTAPLDALCARVTEPGDRPLFDQPVETVAALLQTRMPYYRQAHACVATDELGVEGAVERVRAIAGYAAMIPLELLPDASVVALSERSYPVLVGVGLLDRLGDLVRRALGERCRQLAVISDDHVGPLYAGRVESSLRAAGFSVTVATVPAGEQSKSFAQLTELSETLAATLDRRSAIVALGGGVIGDLAGFLAASLFRGIACVQVPTSLLAMVDSAIGGKTGINLSKGKNLFGAFWQPRAVIADPGVLATLPAREYRAGFGELVKYGLLSGERLLSAIAALAPTIGALPETPEGADAALDSPDVAPGLSEVIRQCASHKGWIVTRDEREQTGERALLNLGHTLGHAIEAEAGYGRVLHGEAVALGLLATCRVSASLGRCRPELETRVAAILARAGLDNDLRPWLRPEVMAWLAVDKKRAGRNLDFIAVSAPGTCQRVAIPMDNLARILLGEISV